MGVVNSAEYAEMLDRAKKGGFAYPAINVSSSQTLNAALAGLQAAGSDGILQVTTGGADYWSGPTIKNRVSGALQVVDVEIPGTLGATVGDALRHLVLRSGYRLCDEQSTDLLALPLPAAHYRLGPLLLRDALLTLAGPVWDLQVDDGERKVCFIRSLREAHTPHEPKPPEINRSAEPPPLIREVSP